MIWENELHWLFRKASILATQDVVISVMYPEQCAHEEHQAVAMEAVDWVLINVTEQIYEYYTQALLKYMWFMPDCRKGMLQYCGLYTKNIGKAQMLEDAKKKQEGKLYTEANNPKGDWMKAFVTETHETEMDSLPISYSVASVRIQARIRGVLDRKHTRKVFVNTFAKRYDSSTGNHYYFNINTQEAMWERPKITKYFFPNSKW
jgi:hypothetical protein